MTRVFGFSFPSGKRSDRVQTDRFLAHKKAKHCSKNFFTFRICTKWPGKFWVKVPTPRSEHAEIYGRIRNLPWKLSIRYLDTLGRECLRKLTPFTIVAVTRILFNWLNISRSRTDSTSCLKRSMEVSWTSSTQSRKYFKR